MRLVATSLAFLLAAACGDDDRPASPDGGGTPDDPDASPGDPDADVTPIETYEFDSRFVDGASSVAYTGQALRQVLMNDLNAFIVALDGLSPEEFPTDVEGDLLFYYTFDVAANGQVPLLLSTEPAALQESYGAIGSGNLATKIAGKDATGQHKDWETPGTFVGWPATDADTPDELVRFYIAEIDRLADAFTAGSAPLDPTGTQIASASVDADGRHYRQLLGKFLLGAVAYSQATDDYWDDADEDHGINVNNADPSGDGSAYSSLEHHWDEGFGYFGAARDYLGYTDEEIAARGGRETWQRYHDTDDDDRIDLTAEFNFTMAGYAAQRDLGSDASAPTDFTGDIFGAMLAGRRLIAQAGGELDADGKAQLQEYRDAAVLGWERVLAANVIHYINDTLRDMNAFDTEDYNFLSHAAHWSEAKGFALGLQFNPRKKLTDAEFLQLHTLLGDAPVLPDALPAAIAAHRAALLEARALLAEVYEFDAANVGDDNGENGW